MGNSLSLDEYFGEQENDGSNGRRGTIDAILRPNGGGGGGGVLGNKNELSVDTEADARRKIYSQRIKEELEDKGAKTQFDKQKHRSAIIIQKHWKGFSQRRKWTLFLAKSKVLKELLMTEKDYVNYMNIIMDVYCKPLMEVIQANNGGKDRSHSISSLVSSSRDSSSLNGSDRDSTSSINSGVSVGSGRDSTSVGGRDSVSSANGKNSRSSNSIKDNKGKDGGRDSVSSSNGKDSRISSSSSSSSSSSNKDKDSGRDSVSSKDSASANVNVGIKEESSVSSMKPDLQKEFSFLDETPLTADEIKIVFSQIEVIRKYNTMLLEKIQQRVSDLWDDSMRIGDVFLEIIDFLKVPYSHYIINFPACLKVLENASKRPSYMLFIQQCKSIDKVARRDLQSFVSMPIQRIPRYVLLLRELLKYTLPTHADYENIYKALRRMESIAELINRQMKEDEHSKVVMQIALKLKPPVDSLIQPHRRLIREGEAKIIKTDGNNHEAQYATIKPSSMPFQSMKVSHRYFYLFNDMFIITKKMKSYFKVEKVIGLQYSTIVDHYVKRADRPPSVTATPTSPANSSSSGSNNVNNNSNKDKDVNSINNMIVSLKSNSSNSNSNVNDNGERHFFKLHSLDCAVVICLPTESEKIQWKNDFIGVINQITENSISFNPKWSRNNLIFGEEKARGNKQKGTAITPENFKMKISISELLAVSDDPFHPSPASTGSKPLNNTPVSTAPITASANNTPYKPNRSASVCEPDSESDASKMSDDSDNENNENNNNNSDPKPRSYSVSAVETLSPLDRIRNIFK